MFTREEVVVIPYQVRSYQTHNMRITAMRKRMQRRNPLSSQVISNQALTFLPSSFLLPVVIPYQVRSYQTSFNAARKQAKAAERRNPLSSQVISNVVSAPGNSREQEMS